MSFAISISFPAGRFHATPWGTHVNEGIPEWPPSPWRIIRAIVAVWKRKLNHNPELDTLIPQAISKLVAPPSYKLPPSSIGHTVHFMPSHKKWKGEEPHKSRDQIFDTFIVMDRNGEVVVAWPDATLDDNETRAIASVISLMSYLGRAESLATLALSSVPDPERLNCCPELSSQDNHPSGSPHETVTVMAPDCDTWNHWSYQNDAYKPDPCWNILAETRDIHAEKWSRPPGSREVTYILKPDSDNRPLLRRRQPHKTMQVVRYTLDSPVLPLITETVHVAEIARHYIQGIFGRKFHGAFSPVLSGKTIDGQPLAGHSHAFFLPTDEDGDMRLDHLTIFSSKGFDLGRELQALDSFQKMHSPKTGSEIRLLLVGTGDITLGSQIPIISKSLKWRSITPFIPVRHYKTRGQKKDTCAYDAFPEVVLREELLKRGFPQPTRVVTLPRCDLWDHAKKGIANNLRNLSWLQFRRERVMGNGKKGQHPGCGFEIEFEEPVQGPVAMGYGCHYGLGLFAPA